MIQPFWGETDLVDVVYNIRQRFFIVAQTVKVVLPMLFNGPGNFGNIGSNNEIQLSLQQ